MNDAHPRKGLAVKQLTSEMSCTYRGKEPFLPRIVQRLRIRIDVVRVPSIFTLGS